MALYHQLVGKEGKARSVFGGAANFFDLIIVDECHRGSAKDDSAWRKVLEYFSSATQIGMTATPKADEGANNLDYFGEPVYTYSLLQESKMVSWLHIGLLPTSSTLICRAGLPMKVK